MAQSTQQQFRCRQCGKSFNSQNELQQHEQNCKSPQLR